MTMFVIPHPHSMTSALTVRAVHNSLARVQTRTQQLRAAAEGLTDELRDHLEAERQLRSLLADLGRF